MLIFNYRLDMAPVEGHGPGENKIMYGGKGMTIKKLFKKAIGAIVAGAMVVAMAIPAMAEGSSEEHLYSVTLEENGEIDEYKFGESDDLSKVASAKVYTSGTTDYVKGIMGGNDADGNWYKTSEDGEEYTIADGKGSIEFKNLKGFKDGALLQFYWVNKGTFNIDKIELFDADGAAIKTYSGKATEEVDREPLYSVTLEENGEIDEYKFGESDDLSKVASAKVYTSGTTDYVKGIMGGNDADGNWYKTSEDGEEYTIADGKGSIEFKNLKGFKDGALLQFYWVNKGTFNIDKIELFDADGNVIKTYVGEPKKTDETTTPAETTTAAEAPTEKPTEAPTEKPTEAPTEKPTETPAGKPVETVKELPLKGGNSDLPYEGGIVLGNWKEYARYTTDDVVLKAGDVLKITYKDANGGQIGLTNAGWKDVKKDGNYIDLTDGEGTVEYKFTQEDVDNLKNAVDDKNHYLVIKGKKATITKISVVSTSYVEEETTATVSENKPFIKGADGKEGWEVITSELTAVKDGATITVEMNGATKVPGNVVAGIKGKDVTVVIDLGNGISWSINGKTVTSDKVADIDFSLKKDTNAVPADTVKKVADGKTAVQFSLAHDGNFGFDAVLSIDLDKKNAGLYANLFYYNPTSKALEFVEAAKIAEDGTAALAFKHASDYVIVLDKTAYSTEATTTTQATASNATGDSANIGLIIALAAAVAVLGVTVAVKKRATEE